MIKLEGLDQLQKQIDGMGKKLESGTKERALQAGGERFKTAAQVNVRKKTWNLHDSIVVSDVENDNVAVGPEIVEGETVSQGRAYYGRFLELGTSKMDPKPFMGPAYESSKDAVQEVMRDVIKRDLGL